MKKLHHICIQARDYQASLDFYVRILGFTVVKETKNFHKRAYNTWLDLDGFMIELQTSKEGQSLKEFSKDSEGIVHFCFYVEDIDGEYKHIRECGYSKFNSKNGEDIYSVEGGKLFKVVSPEGTIIEFRDQMEL